MGNGNTHTTSKTIKSVDTTLDILEWLLENRGGTVTEVGNGAGVSASTAHHHLTTLAKREYVERFNNHYHVGVRFLTFGGLAREMDPVYSIGRETIDWLAERTGGTARLVVGRKSYGITLYQASGEPSKAPPVPLGAQKPLHTTAAGRVILAYLPSDHVDRTLERGGPSNEASPPEGAVDTLEDELEEIRSTGVAFGDEEFLEGHRSVAGAIVQDGDLLGAVSFSVSTSRHGEAWIEGEGVNYIRNATGVIKVNNNYRSWMNPPE